MSGTQPWQCTEGQGKAANNIILSIQNFEDKSIDRFFKKSKKWEILFGLT